MLKKLTDKSGFSLFELIVTLSIFGVMMAIAIPSFLSYRPTMRIKGAARDITTTLQWARMKAVSENNTFAVKFEGSSYSIYDDNDNDDVYNPDETDSNDPAIRTSTLPDGISFGVGTTVNRDVSGGGTPTDFITFGGDACDFSSNGTADSGTVYIINTKDESYAVTVSSSGRALIRRWDGDSWESS